MRRHRRGGNMSLIAHRPGMVFPIVIMPLFFLGLAAALIWRGMGPDVILGLTLGGIALFIMSLRPYLALHAFLFLLFFENAFAEQEGITVMKALGVVILGGWLASIMIRRRLGVRASVLLIAMLAFLAWSGFCVLSAFDAEPAIVQTTSYGLMILAAVMFSSLVESPRQLRWILLAFVGWTCVATLVAIIMYYAGATVVAVGFAGNRNLLALYINLAVVCALLTFPSSTRRLKFGLALSIPCLLLGLCLTLSRTGIILMGLVMIVSWLRLARHRGLLMVIGSIASLTALVFLLPGAFWQRTEGIVPTIEHREDTFGLRLRIWEVGVRMIKAHPVVGVGTGNFVPASQRYARGEILGEGLASHNMYVHVAAETGLVGLGLLLVVVTLGLFYARRAFRRARDAGDSALALDAVSVEMMILVFLGQGITGDVVVLKCFWVVFGLSLVLDSLTKPLATDAAEHASRLARAIPEGAGA
jgi:hypothetical protein